MAKVRTPLLVNGQPSAQWRSFDSRAWIRAAMNQGKIHRLILSTRDRFGRPEIGSFAAVLRRLDVDGFKPVGDLYGIADPTLRYAGRWGALGCVVGETETETFLVGLPISRYFFATTAGGDERRFPISHFDNAILAQDGSAIVFNKQLVRDIRFDAVDLTFDLTGLQRHIAYLTIDFLNDSGMSDRVLGRKLPTGFIDFNELSKIELKELEAVMAFITSHWESRHSGRPVPSRESIATTLEALSVRSRRRGRNSIKNTILPHINLRKQKL